MTEIFYDDKLTAAILIAVGLLISQFSIFLIKKQKGQKIYGLEIFYEGTLAYTENKKILGFIYFVIVPIFIYVCYELIGRFLGTSGFLYNLFVLLVSGGFGLLLSITLATFITAFLLFRVGQSLLHFQFKLYSTLIAIAFILGGVYFTTGDLFFRNAFIISTLVGTFNLSITTKTRRKLLTQK